MDTAVARHHLAEAERHVAEGERRIGELLARIAEAERAGHDTTQARALLQTFEDSQAMHVADRARIREELEQVERP